MGNSPSLLLLPFEIRASSQYNTAVVHETRRPSLCVDVSISIAFDLEDTTTYL